MDQLDDGRARRLWDVVQDTVFEGLHGVSRRWASAQGVARREASGSGCRSAGGSCGGGSRAPQDRCEHLWLPKGHQGAAQDSALQDASKPGSQSKKSSRWPTGTGSVANYISTNTLSTHSKLSPALISDTASPSLREQQEPRAARIGAATVNASRRARPHHSIEDDGRRRRRLRQRRPRHQQP